MEKIEKRTAADKENIKLKPNHFNIGCTIVGDPKVSEIEMYRSIGINTFQIMAEFDRRGHYKPLSKIAMEILSGSELIFHMPFYFHLLLQKNAKRAMMFSSLQNNLREKPGTRVIVHCKGVHLFPGRTRRMMSEYLRYYSRICRDLVLCLENDAGGKSNQAPRIKDISSVVNLAKANGRSNVGLCVDTQHAYAAGDNLFSINLRDNVDILHMNSIPKYVKFGGHLDRHSEAYLKDSKKGTGFVRKILGLLRPGTPIILERTLPQVIKSDAYLIKEMTNDLTFQDVDKKNLGKALRKKKAKLHREGNHD